MIDVVFLLLIFFVVASVGQKPAELLPATIAEGTSNSVEVAPPEQLVQDQKIRVILSRLDDSLKIQLNGRTVTPDELQLGIRRLADIDLSSQVILDVKDDVLVQHFMTVYERFQVLGFQIYFAVPGPQ